MTIAIYAAIEGTAQRVADGFLLLPGAAVCVFLAIGVLWYVGERSLRS